jgi:hypothetical protein
MSSHTDNSHKKARALLTVQYQQEAHNPLLLPGPVNECLSNFLRNSDIKTLSSVSRAAKNEYGGKLKKVTLLWENKATDSLLALLERQESLRVIHTNSTSLLPSLLIAIDRGYCSFLTSLRLCGWGIENHDKRLHNSSISALAGLMKQGALHSLEKFKMDPGEKGGVEMMMQAFKAGACPNLESLDVPLVYFIELGIYLEGTDSEYDLEETHRNLEALADAFEARRTNATCKSLRVLDGHGWIDRGGAVVCTRVLRVLLPSGGVPAGVSLATTGKCSCL